MLKYDQISFIEYPELINSARYGVNISPEKFSMEKVMVIERSFDDLGEYSFIGLNVEGIKLGMRRHTSSGKEYSYVSVMGAKSEKVERNIICKIFEIPETEIVEFDDDW